MHVNLLQADCARKVQTSLMIQEDMLAYDVPCEPLQLGLPEWWVTGPC